MVTVNVTSFEVSRKSDLSQSSYNKVLKSVNLQFNTVGRRDNDMIVPPSDGP